MKALLVIGLGLALTGCAAVPPVFIVESPQVPARERPPVLHVGGPAAVMPLTVTPALQRALPQQVVGEERHDLVLDGVS